MDNNCKVCCKNCRYWVENIAKPSGKGIVPTYMDAHDGVCHYMPQAILTVEDYWCNKYYSKHKPSPTMVPKR